MLFINWPSGAQNCVHVAVCQRQFILEGVNNVISMLNAGAGKEEFDGLRPSRESDT